MEQREGTGPKLCSVEMKNIVAYGYSPKHTELLYSLCNVLPTNKITLIGPKDFLDSTISRYKGIFDFDAVVLPRQTKEVGLIKRLIARGQISYLLRGVKADILVTSNELAPASIILSKAGTCKEIIVLDEGDFDVIFAKEGVLSRYKWASQFKKIISGGKCG
jgi:hypothetical protein